MKKEKIRALELIFKDYENLKKVINNKEALDGYLITVNEQIYRFEKEGRNVDIYRAKYDKIKGKV